MAPAEPVPAPVAAGEAQVHFTGEASPFDISEDQSILDVADENDVDIDYECWCGMCGCDLIRIVEGRGAPERGDGQGDQDPGQEGSGSGGVPAWPA